MRAVRNVVGRDDRGRARRVQRRRWRRNDEAASKHAVKTRGTPRRTSSSTTSSSTSSTTATTVPFNGLRPGDSGPRGDRSPDEARRAPLRRPPRRQLQRRHHAGGDGVPEGERPRSRRRRRRPDARQAREPGDPRAARAGRRLDARRGRRRAAGAVLLPGQRAVQDRRGVDRQRRAVLRRRSVRDRGHARRIVPRRRQGRAAGRPASSVELYKPSYFNGNIAIHGAPSVPGGRRRTAACGCR